MGSATIPPKGKGQRGGGRRPVDSKTRARVEELARGEMGRNAIATLLDLSPSTVTRICQQAKPPIHFDRKATEVAVEARKLDAAERRSRLAGRMLDLADEFDRLMFKPTVHITETDGVETKRTIAKTPHDWKETMVSIGTALDKHLVLVRHDGTGGELSAVDAWFEHIQPTAEVLVPEGWE